MNKIRELEKLYQLSTMVLTSETDDVNLFSLAGAVYIFSQTADNQEAVFQRAAGLLRNFRLSVALIDDYDATNKGYPGAAKWLEGLQIYGVPENSAVRIPLYQPLNTLSEAWAVVKFAKEQAWTEMVIVAPAFHQLRCFLSMVTAVAHCYPSGLRVYNCPATRMYWDETVRHSPGMLRATRRQLVLNELNRILKYQKAGKPFPLVSGDEAIQYLRWRDR